MRTFLLTGLVGVMALSSQASAATLVDDGFEYTNQAAFETAWPPVTATSTLLDETRAASGVKSVTVPANVTSRNGQTVAELGNPSADNTITWSFDFYDSNSAVAPYRQSSNLQDGGSPGSGGQLVSMGLHNNLTSAADGGNFYMARILGFNGGAYFKLNDTGAPLRSTDWHNLKVVIDDQSFRFYVDGILSETVSQAGLTLRSYDTLRLGSGVTSTHAAGFDNMFLSTGPAVPEPAFASVLALGLIGLLARRGRAARTV